MPARPNRQELTLWGEPFEEHQKRGELPPIPLDFEGRDVRLFFIRDEPWWVAADACRSMGIGNASLAVNGQERTREDGTAYRSGGLDEDERRIHTVNTPTGPVDMLLVNEPGIYALAFKGRTEEARRFKRWLTHEVLPALRRSGTYSIVGSPVAKTARRLRCDALTAAKRLQNRDVNKACNGRIAAEGGCPNDHKMWHNAGHRGKTGLDAVGLRRALEIRGRRTPLDRSAAVVLTLDSHAKTVAERLIQDSPTPLTHSQKAEILERTNREMADAVVSRLGAGYALGVREDARRGKILDLIRIASIETDTPDSA